MDCGCQDSIRLGSLGWYALGKKTCCEACHRTWATPKTIQKEQIKALANMCEVCLDQMQTSDSSGRGNIGGSQSSLTSKDQAAALIAMAGQLDHHTTSMVSFTQEIQLLHQRLTNLKEQVTKILSSSGSENGETS